MNIEDQPTSVDLGDYLALIRRRVVLIAAVMSIVTALVLALGSRQPRSYQASVKIVVRPTYVDPNAVRPEIVDPATERQVMLSVQVAERASERLGTGITAAVLLANLSVTVPDDTGVLAVSYRAASPLVAQRTAQTLAETYLALRTEQASQKLAGQRESVGGELQKAEAALQGVNRVLVSTPETAAENADALARREVLLSEITQLQLRRSRLSAIETDGGGIISAALEPTIPAGAGPVKNGIIGGAAGLVLGVMAAFVRDRTDRRLRTVAQAERLFHLPVLGTVPAFRRRRDAGVITLTEPEGPGADVFRRLRARLLSSYDLSQACIVVTSSRPGEGKSLVASNLALTLARTGGRVALLQADPHRPTLHGLLGKPVSPGLAEVLREEAKLDDALQWLADDRLAFIAAGTGSQHVADRLQSEAMRTLHRQLKARFDFVVVDTPPLRATADGLALAPLADVVVLVASGSYKSEDADLAVTELAQAGAGRVGLVLNRFSGAPTFHQYYQPEPGPRADEPVKLHPHLRRRSRPSSPIPADDAVAMGMGER